MLKYSGPSSTAPGSKTWTYTYNSNALARSFDTLAGYSKTCLSAEGENASTPFHRNAHRVFV